MYFVRQVKLLLDVCMHTTTSRMAEPIGCWSCGDRWYLWARYMRSTLCVLELSQDAVRMDFVELDATT